MQQFWTNTNPASTTIVDDGVSGPHDPSIHEVTGYTTNDGDADDDDATWSSS